MGFGLPTNRRTTFSTAWTVFETGLECLLKVTELLLIGLLGSSEARGTLLALAKSFEKCRTLPRIHPKFIGPCFTDGFAAHGCVARRANPPRGGEAKPKGLSIEAAESLNSGGLWRESAALRRGCESRYTMVAARFEANPNYHTVSDTCVDPEYAADIVRSVAAAPWATANL
jgi:hypothetical protein